MDDTQMQQKDNPLVVYAYTRKQAIEEGVLVDITVIAKKYGFVIPVARPTCSIDM